MLIGQLEGVINLGLSQDSLKVSSRPTKIFLIEEVE